MDVVSRSESVVGEILSIRTMHRKFIKRSLAKLNETELHEVDQYIAFLESRGVSTKFMAECYLTIVDDTFKEEIYLSLIHI